MLNKVIFIKVAILYIICGIFKTKGMNKMKTVWLINPYGPIEGENWRDYSFNQFGKYLSSNGYKVVWWTSNFAHHFKKYRSNGWEDIVINNDYIIRLVPTIKYNKNFSFKRFLRDIDFGIKIRKNAKKHNLPDIIIEYANPLNFGVPTYRLWKKNHIPYIINQMDIWPEFVLNQTSSIFKPMLRLLLIPIYKIRKKVYNNSQGLIALGSNYLNFATGIMKNKNKPSALIYNGVDVFKFRENMKNSLTPELLRILPKKDKDEIWFVFAGTFGPSYDILALIEAANCAKSENLKVKFLLAGSGPLVENVELVMKSNETIIYLGSLLPHQLAPIYNLCDVGLATYSSKSNVDMPDKFYDYTASGLAILNSLTGEVKDFIEEKKCGLNYKASNSKDLFNKIKVFISDGLLLDEFKINSWELGDFFDLNNQNKHLIKVIEQVLEVNHNDNS